MNNDIINVYFDPDRYAVIPADIDEHDLEFLVTYIEAFIKRREHGKRDRPSKRED